MLVPYLMRLPIERAKGCRSMLSVSECNLSHFNIQAQLQPICFLICAITVCI
jgi:hypothetical protein